MEPGPEEPAPPPPEDFAPPRGRGLTLRDFMACVFILAILISAFGGVVLKLHAGRQRTKCANSLRQLALAAIQYGDDKRFLPHLSALTVLDGGGSTRPRGSDVSPRCIRALFFHVYFDGPGVTTCPSSGDDVFPAAFPPGAGAGTIGWGGVIENGASPILAPGIGDRDADALRDLSYGYTIKALNSNARSSSRILADRNPENHRQGWNVATIDAAIRWVVEPERLSGTEVADGFLVVWDELNLGLR